MNRAAIIVLGAPLGPGGAPNAPLRLRLELALSLAERDPGALVVVSGGAVKSAAEGPAMARWLAERGLSEDRILIEAGSRRTIENADFAIPLLAGRGVGQVLVVSQRSHARRGAFNVRVALRRAGLDRISVQGLAAPDPPGSKVCRGAAIEACKLLQDALIRIARVWMAGPSRPARGAGPP